MVVIIFLSCSFHLSPNHFHHIGKWPFQITIERQEKMDPEAVLNTRLQLTSTWYDFYMYKWKLILLLNASTSHKFFTCYNTRLIDSCAQPSRINKYRFNQFYVLFNLFSRFLYMNLIVDFNQQTDVNKNKKKKKNELVWCKSAKKSRLSLCLLCIEQVFRFDTISYINLCSSLWFFGSVETWNIKQNGEQKRIYIYTKRLTNKINK